MLGLATMFQGSLDYVARTSMTGPYPRGGNGRCSGQQKYNCAAKKRTANACPCPFSLRCCPGRPECSSARVDCVLGRLWE